jgi:hypothetical protein
VLCLDWQTRLAVPGGEPWAALQPRRDLVNVLVGREDCPALIRISSLVRPSPPPMASTSPLKPMGGCPVPACEMIAVKFSLAREVYPAPEH